MFIKIEAEGKRLAASAKGHKERVIIKTNAKVMKNVRNGASAW